MKKLYSVKVRAVCLIHAHHVEAESEEDLKKVIANKSFTSLWAEIPSLESIEFSDFPDVVDFEEEK
jgi:hypothetical protein